MKLFLRTKLGTLRPMRRSSLLKLPGELLLLIGRQVRRTQDLKNLRLVCKVLDGVFAPIVLSNIYLGYASFCIPTRHKSLRDLIRRNKSLDFVKSLNVDSLEWLLERPILQPEGFQEHCWAALHYLRLASTHSFRHLRSAKDTSLSNELARVQRKYYFTELQECILSNLESAKWYMQSEPKRSSTSFLKFLVLLPSLKVLDLSLEFYNTKDLDSFMYLLVQVSGLQSLTLRLRCGQGRYHESYVQWFGRLIANNTNLAYLRLKWCDNEDQHIPLLSVFRHVPVDCPTRLKHLVLDSDITDSEPGIIPHWRSLQSLNLYSVPPLNFWEILALNGIFIPILIVGFADEALCKYLLLNASLVSFTIATPDPVSQTPAHLLGCLNLFRTLETTDVVQITISPFNWGYWYENAEVEACLRRCVKLQRITLDFGNGHIPVHEDIRATAETVSRLGDKISLEISGAEGVNRAFKECCQLEDPLMKSLRQRLMFLEPQDLESRLGDSD